MASTESDASIGSSNRVRAQNVRCGSFLPRFGFCCELLGIPWFRSPPLQLPMCLVQKACGVHGKWHVCWQRQQDCAQVPL